jgi:hypothetical protein
MLVVQITNEKYYIPDIVSHDHLAVPTARTG